MTMMAMVMRSNVLRPSRLSCYHSNIHFVKPAPSTVLLLCQQRHRRSLRTGAKLAVSSTTAHEGPGASSTVSPYASSSSVSTTCSPPPSLSILPLSTLLRSYAITTLSCTPWLLAPSMRILTALVHSSSPFLNPDRNPLLHWALKKTFYAQYCAGESPQEVRRTVEELKRVGYKGVILGFAREVVMDEGETKGKIGEGERVKSAVGDEWEEVRAWKDGTLETVRLAGEEDCVALKFTGAGSQVLHRLLHQMQPNKALQEAMAEICRLAQERKTRLLFDAEQTAVQQGIDAWTLEFQRRYNGLVSGRAMIYGTYQAYKRDTPTILAEHLAIAAKEGFTLGVKLVRGAYLGSDPRHLFWSRKEETDKAYNELANSLIRREYADMLRPKQGEKKFPDVNLVIASHNLESVNMAMELRAQQLQRGEKCIHMVYGQLMGMADHVSCKLIQAGDIGKEVVQSGKTEKTEIPRAYKYIVWGTVGECLKYLLRRAEENRDAVTRTRDGRDALGAELKRRVLLLSR